jgi:endonuclease YncB( thermonuclease family)
MRLKTRQVVVVALSEPWILDPELVNPPPPPPVTPDDPDLLAQYQAELSDYPSAYPALREYGRVVTVHDGDTVTVDVYSDANASVPSTITHPDTGVKYSRIRIRIASIQAPETDWLYGYESTISLRNFLAVNDVVMLRADQDKSADALGNPRVWREMYKKSVLGDWYNVGLHQLDAGWAYAFPLSHEPRNTMNRIVHTKLAAYYGKGVFATPSAHYGKFALSVFPNPEGTDTPAGEYLRLKNLSAGAINIGGWRIGDPSPLSSYLFPAGTTIAAGQEFIIYVGVGTNGGGRFYMGLTKILLNNDYEVAVLHDNTGPSGTSGKIAAITQCINSVNTPIPINVVGAIRSANPEALDLTEPTMGAFPGVGG